MPDHPLERLYQDHASALFAFALNLTRSEADARDVLQELFLKLTRRGALPAGLQEERGYLLRMVHHGIVDSLRRRDVRSRAENVTLSEPAMFAPSADPDEDVFRRDLSAALGELPPDQRAVVHLKLWEGLTFERIAATLEIPPNTAASRYRYGIDKLRTRLRPLYEEIQ